MSKSADSLRQLMSEHRREIDAVLARYGARNPELFGSVARGDAGPTSDIDLFVDLSAGVGNPLLRVAGIGEVLSELLGVRVDVVSEELLRPRVLATTHHDRIAL